MSFDIFVQGFLAGEAASLPTEAFHDVFGRYIDRTELEHGYRHLQMPDGSEADTYARLEGNRFDGLMVNRCGAGAVFDLLAAFARRTGAVIMPVGCPTLIPTPDQCHHLPDELRDGPVLVIATGHDIAEAIRTA